jgi:hypothetical protein
VEKAPLIVSQNIYLFTIGAKVAIGKVFNGFRLLN